MGDKEKDTMVETVSEEEFRQPEEAEASEEPEEAEEQALEPEEEESSGKKLNIEDLEGLRGDGEAKWYVVHTYSGHENKVKASIEKIVQNRGMQELIQDVVVPTEDWVEIKDGQRKVKTRKMFPGYVIIKMIVTNESWYLVRNTQGVTGFVGHGSDPIPLSTEEVRRMGIEKIHIEHVDVGDTVKIINGSFEGYIGVVEKVNVGKEKLKAKIPVFGGDRLFELDFTQVDKI